MVKVYEDNKIYPGYELPQELKDLQMKYRKFNAGEIIPLEEEIDYDAHVLPEEHYKRLVKKTRAEGMWCPEVPKKYGGQGLGCFAMCIVYEEWSQHRAGLSGVCGYGVYGMPPVEAIWGGTEEQIKKYAIPAVEQGYPSLWAASEPGPGSDASNVQTSATKEGDYYILNGVKHWASNAYESPWGLITARTSPDRYKGINAFIIELDWPGITLIDMPHSRSVRSPKMIMENVKVPRENLLGGKEGKGFYDAMEYFNATRPLYSANSIGGAVYAQRVALDFARKREIWGEPIIKKQTIQNMLVDSEMDIAAARWLVWNTAWKTDKGEDTRVETAMAKVFSVETLDRVVDRAVQICGGYGVTKIDCPLERLYREARPRRNGRGASEPLRFRVMAPYLEKLGIPEGFAGPRWSKLGIFEE